ncbi:5-aminolevulic acid synthase [Roseitranquillus sediminis]|uniref:5-aminolevulic acid synthase n=1 Tax=Roseitranquillus sediminis TaxID=2809051 RepID=UPI001D0CD8DD|nr:5-aminolevulic acid synthase [Roseitranquillus sediminis]MBM9596450.1 5-aminolevulic acid synthase [Roseitranquillus sediminis]
MRSILLAVALTLAAVGAQAQAVDGDAAERQLFPVRGIAVAVGRQLSPQDQAIVRAMFDPAVIRQAGQSFSPLYYGSIAFSPDEGLQSEALRGAYNFHSTRASDAAALAACNAARASGTRPCEIAGQVLPRGYEPRALTLSLSATQAFRDTYRRASTPKALAVSAATGEYSMARGPGAGDTARADCNAKVQAAGGAADCFIAVAD